MITNIWPDRREDLAVIWDELASRESDPVKAECFAQAAATYRWTAANFPRPQTRLPFRPTREEARDD